MVRDVSFQSHGIFQTSPNKYVTLQPFCDLSAALGPTRGTVLITTMDNPCQCAVSQFQRTSMLHYLWVLLLLLQNPYRFKVAVVRIALIATVALRPNWSQAIHDDTYKLYISEQVCVWSMCWHQRSPPFSNIWGCYSHQHGRGIKIKN